MQASPLSRPIVTPPPAVAASTRPIRVMHFHSSKGLYGPERWTHLALRALADGPIEQEVLTIGTKPGYDDFATFLTREGFTAHHLAIGGKLALGQIRAIRGVLLARRIDVLHTHGFKSDILGYVASRGMDVGLVTTPHGWCDHESLRIRAYETVGRAFLRGFERVYPLSTHQVAKLAPYRLGARVRMIRNAVDIAAFDDVRRARLASTSPYEHVLFVGRLAKEKGVFDLMHAAARLAKGRRIPVVVVGEGPASQELAALVERLGLGSDVKMMGFREDIRPFLERAALLALPSYSEGIPRVVMEAFAAGVPVVGSNIPGLRELTDGGRAGILVSVGDAAALAEAIERVMTDGIFARDLAQRARTIVEQHYSPARLADELTSEYARLAALRAPHGRS